MPVLNCKMCCAPLKITDDGMYAKCTYCGTVYTLPLDDYADESIQAMAEPLLKRARIYLEDSIFKSAAEYYEKVLDLVPSMGEAYLGKGMAQLGINKMEDLEKVRRAAAGNYYIKKALVFLGEPLRTKLYNTLGMKKPVAAKESAIEEWRKNADMIRRSFLEDVSRNAANHSTEYTEEMNKIERKYNGDIAKYAKRIDDIKDLIVTEKKRDLNKDYAAKVWASAENIDKYESEKAEMQQKMHELEINRNAEIEELNKRFPESGDVISKAVFDELKSKHTIPELPDESDGTILDKICDILMSEYGIISQEEIAAHKFCGKYSELRINNALKKLINQRKISEVTVDGKTGYILSDLEEIKIV